MALDGDLGPVGHRNGRDEGAELRRGQAAAVVVDDHRLPGAQAPLAGSFLQGRHVGQRMPSIGGLRGSGELGVKVDVDRGRDVGRPVVITAAGVTECPPDVEDRGRVRLAEELVQGHRIDEDVGGREPRLIQRRLI